MISWIPGSLISQFPVFSTGQQYFVVADDGGCECAFVHYLPDKKNTCLLARLVFIVILM